MLRYTKYCAMSLFIIVVMCSVSFTAQAAVEDVETYEASTWENTMYYIASLSGFYGQTTNYVQDIELTIMAVNDYELYVNGDQYSDADDGDWTTPDTYTINLGGDDEIRIGVKVTNNGLGDGNGLIVGIEAGTDQLGTWTKVRETQYIDNTWQFVPVAWWTFGEAEFEELGFDDTWYDFNTDLFTDTNKRKIMRRALKGEINTSIDHAFPPDVEVITGYLGSDVDTGAIEGGGLTLRRMEGENIALDKPAQIFEHTDGALEVGVAINSPLNQTRFFDLGQIYRVNQMTIFTGNSNPSQFEDLSMRGYAVDVSLDNYRYEEVGIIHDIGIPDKNGNVNEGGFDHYSVDFPGEWARYIRFRITEVRTTGTPSVGEVMVYGTGYVLEGDYVSDWQDLGNPDSYKNFDMVSWTGSTPEGTEITVQTQTKNGVDGVASPWSEPMSAATFAFSSPEPATHFRYKVNLATQDIEETPVFSGLEVTYSQTSQPVSLADGYISPNEVPMGDDVEFTYTLAYELTSGQNLKEVVIAVPGLSTLNSVTSAQLGDLGAVDDDTVDKRADISNLYVTLNNEVTSQMITGVDTLSISFDSKLLKSSHEFHAYVYSTGGNDGAGGIMVWESVGQSNVVRVNQLVKSILSDVEAVPKVITPNGGVNDFGVIEFRLAKVNTNVMIKVYSSSGTLVTTIFDDMLEAGDYKAEGSASVARGMPGYWDGKDEDGDLVPPGIYVYQIVAETDNENVVEGGTVVVAY